MDETRLLALHREGIERSADVVLVHGLKGTIEDTWTGRTDTGESTYWPGWLAEDFPDLGVWVFGYPSTLVDWTRATLPMAELATNLGHRLRNQGIGERPLLLLGHSMGGLIIKQMLVDAAIYANPELARLWHSTAAAAFLATPHRGSDLASWAEMFKRWAGSALGIGILGGRSNVDDLKRHAPALCQLNAAFCQHVSRRHSEGTWPQVMAYVEGRPVKGAVMVVEPDSADHGIVTAEKPVTLPADHFEICKFANRRAEPYEWLCRQLGRLREGAPEFLRRPEGKVFVSYFRTIGEAPGDDERASELIGWLRRQGVRVQSDIEFRARRAPSEGWRAWRDRALQGAYTVIILCDERYGEVFAPAQTHQAGSTSTEDESEDVTGGTVTPQALARCGGLNDRFIPVLWDDAPLDHLPRAWRDHYGDHRFPSRRRHLLEAICMPPQSAVPRGYP